MVSYQVSCIDYFANYHLEFLHIGDRPLLETMLSEVHNAICRRQTTMSKLTCDHILFVDNACKPGNIKSQTGYVLLFFKSFLLPKWCMSIVEWITVRCRYNAVQHVMILHTISQSQQQNMSDFELTKDTSYLALMGDIWRVCCENFGRKLSAL